MNLTVIQQHACQAVPEDQLSRMLDHLTSGLYGATELGPLLAQAVLLHAALAQRLGIHLSQEVAKALGMVVERWEGQ